MDESATLAPYRRLKFQVRGPFCSTDECRIHPDLMPDVRLSNVDHE